MSLHFMDPTNIKDHFVAFTESWIFETKCRRCGHMTQWFFSYREQTDWLDFSKYIHCRINDPLQYKCDECCKKTVQDIVSYTEPK